MPSRRRFLGVLAASSAAPLVGCGLGIGSYPEKVWGVHGTRPGWLHKPRVAAFDAEDRLYIADLTDRIQVFDRDGTFLRHWRTPDLNVDGPSGLSVDRLGRVRQGYFFPFTLKGLRRILMRVTEPIPGWLSEFRRTQR